MADLRKPGSKDPNIIKTGHTSNGKFGDNPDTKVQGATTTRELGIKAK